MELLGPQQFQDSFAKEMLRFNRGGIVRDISHFYLLVPRNICRIVEVVSKILFADIDS
jgi:hypothetical protein